MSSHDLLLTDLEKYTNDLTSKYSITEDELSQSYIHQSTHDDLTASSLNESVGDVEQDVETQEILKFIQKQMEQNTTEQSVTDFIKQAVEKSKSLQSTPTKSQPSKSPQNSPRPKTPMSESLAERKLSPSVQRNTPRRTPDKSAQEYSPHKLSTSSILKLAHSPNTSFTQPSAAIVRSVLSTPIKDEIKPSPKKEEPTDTITFEDTAIAQYPKPNSDKPSEQLKFYMKQFASKNTKIKLHSLKEMSDVISLDPSSVITIFPEIVAALRSYNTYEESVNAALLDIMVQVKSFAFSAIGIIIQMLKDPSQCGIFDQIMKCMFRLGPGGLQALIEAASDACSEWDSLILSHVANHPMVIENVIVPGLVRECTNQDTQKRINAIQALTRLGVMAKGSLSTLMNLLVSGALDRKLVVQAMKACGQEGEKMLLFLLTHNQHPRIRACAAYALGLKVSSSCKTAIIVNADFATVFASPPRVTLITSETKEYILFDARDLISSLTRGLLDGVYDEVSSIFYEPSPKITELLLYVLDHNKKGGSSTLNTSLSLMHAENSLDAWRLKLLNTSNNTNLNSSTIEHIPTVANLFIQSDVVNALAAALSDIDEPVRIAAASSLGNFNQPVISSCIVSLSAALVDQSNWVRAAAATALGNAGYQARLSSSDLQTLLERLCALLKDSHYNVRYAAVKALRSYGQAVSVESNLCKQTLGLLCKLLKDGSINRNEVAETMNSLGDKGITELIKTLKTVHNSSPIRCSAAHGLSATIINSPFIDKVVECLFGCSKDKVPAVRVAVLQSIGALAKKSNEQLTYLRTRSLLPFLYGFMKDKEKTVREASAELLAAFGPHGELLLIEGLIKDSNPLIRASAAKGLMCVGPKTIRTLLLALGDKDPMVLKSVAHAIESMGVPAIVDAVRNRVKKQRESVMLSVKEVLNSPFPNSQTLEKTLQSLVTELEKLED